MEAPPKQITSLVSLRNDQKLLFKSKSSGNLIIKKPSSGCGSYKTRKNSKKKSGNGRENLLRNYLTDGVSSPSTARTGNRGLSISAINQSNKKKMSSVGTSLTLSQLINFTNELYEAKAKFDKRCTEKHSPKETLEQYMYTYLNNKLGLRKLTLNYATAIIKGIKKYHAQSSEILLFAKILRNEIDEESHDVFLKLKNTVSDILTYYYQTKNPLKSESFVRSLVVKDKSDFLEEEVWKTIVCFLFPHENTQKVVDKIFDFIKEKNDRSEKYKELNSINALIVRRTEETCG